MTGTKTGNQALKKRVRKRVVWAAGLVKGSCLQKHYVKATGKFVWTREDHIRHHEFYACVVMRHGVRCPRSLLGYINQPTT